MKKICVIDYRAGNLFNVVSAFEYLGGNVSVVSAPEQVSEGDLLVLPGVGAFGEGMARLGEQGLVTPIFEWVRAGRPFLGICLGMQLLFETSEEFGAFNGLGVIRGHVRRLPVVPGLKIPNIGWSSLEYGRVGSPESDVWAKTVLEGLPPGQDMYFVHSYACYPEEDDTWLASTAYGEHEFCSVVRQGNVIGCQFHPEKSGKAGLGILVHCMNM